MAQDSIEVLPRRRWWLKPLIVVTSVAVLSVAGFWAYRVTEPARLCKKARAFLDAGDEKNAAVALRRAVSLAPRNEEASRLMVELAERIGSPSAVAWRSHLLELNPSSTSDREALTIAALRNRNIEAAETALSGAPEAFRATAAYEALRGMVAIGKGRWKDAEAAFGEARRRDPGRVSYQLNHSIAQVQSANPKIRDTGIATLTELAKGRQHVAEAKRALVNVNLRSKNLPEAMRWSVDLVLLPEATMEDWLNNLDLVGSQSKADFPAALDRAKSAAVKSPRDLAALLFWAARRGMAAEVRTWAEGLGADKVEEPKVIESYAEVLAAMNDWASLAELTKPRRPWANGDGMRCAFATLAADKAGNAETASNYWQLAVQAVASKREPALQLAYFAHRAGWRPRLLEVLWAASAKEDPEWALRMLHPLCAEDGDTAALLKIAKRLMEVQPSDVGARNNVIQLGLLLGEPAEPLLAAARQLHAEAPTDPVLTSTFAFALYKAGKNEEGLSVLESLPVADLRKPGNALYHALLLAALGKDQPAKEAAAIARTEKMLPEEAALLKNAEK